MRLNKAIGLAITASLSPFANANETGTQANPAINPSATIPCEVANDLAQRIYKRIFEANKTQAVWTVAEAGRAFWDVQSYAASCETVVAISTELSAKGLDKNGLEKISIPSGSAQSGVAGASSKAPVISGTIVNSGSSGWSGIEAPIFLKKDDVLKMLDGKSGLVIDPKISKVYPAQ